MSSDPAFSVARRGFHERLLSEVLLLDEKGQPSNADKSYPRSVQIAQVLAGLLGNTTHGSLKGQEAGKRFEEACEAFLQETFPLCAHLRPGTWHVSRSKNSSIAAFDQYTHLAALDRLARNNKELATALGSDYLIKPDIVIARAPEPDDVINNPVNLVDEGVSRHSSLRKAYQPKALLHASISCKWTIRSDRSQNSRSEGLNLVRNRKGPLPHVVVVTGEPVPSRLASIALGTGDIDCVYHFALNELEVALDKLGQDDARDLVATMVSGKRLKDISDLPLDLAI